MRVLQIVADGSPGGGTTNVLAIIEDLVSMGITDVHLVSQTGSYILEQGEKLGSMTYGINFFQSRFNPSVPLRLKKLYEAVQPDLIHVHGARAGFFLSALSYLTKLPPTAYTVRGYHFLRKPPALRYAAALAEKSASSAADVTVHVCNYDQALAEMWYLIPRKRKRRVIYNGIRTSDIPASETINPKLIGFSGRLLYQKDPLLLIEIIRLLAPDGYKLRIVGGGEMEDEVKERIASYGLQEHVEFLGNLPRVQALSAIREVATFLLPSRWEGLPIAPVEAMYMGIPVVASNVSGIPEIIESGVSGLLVDSRDPVHYAEAIRTLTYNLRMREKIVENAKKVVADKFTRERVIRQYLELYNELIKIS